MIRDQGSWIREQRSVLANRARGSLMLLAASAALLMAGCRQDMQDQPKLIPQRGSEMFADHRGARPQVVNTVARGQLHEDSYFYTGVVQGANGYREEKNEMPFPVTMEVLKRGQERFNIYCTPCHSRVGNGLGAIVQRGYKPAANLHDQVRLAQPISHYFYVMTHGYGAMPDYSAQLTPVDRWAVAAYIRALQLSQAATEKDVPAGAQVKNLKDMAAREASAGRVCRAVGAAGDGGAGISARCRSREHRRMAPANPADPAIKIPLSKPATNRGREVRTRRNGSRDTRQNAPRRFRRPGLCGWLEDAGADCGAVFAVDRRRAGLCGRVDRPCAARMAAGHDADLRLVGGRTGAADGAVLFRAASGDCCCAGRWRR